MALDYNGKVVIEPGQAGAWGVPAWSLRGVARRASLMIWAALLTVPAVHLKQRKSCRGKPPPAANPFFKRFFSKR
ncbi:MAG: hypothetical protein CM15mP21_1270 [Hyphomicrobiales bacterium]|nr:MAG: hypothetical protein CM15mP21_1270 [Hyphomicrobiales bacterium]